MWITSNKISLLLLSAMVAVEKYMHLVSRVLLVEIGLYNTVDISELNLLTLEFKPGHHTACRALSLNFVMP